ncbi:hypothetical protein BaRGS_00018649 [Batillaria attramentaria]|uniref:Uncharacterized protein n=1 Tax=Batillaria attramentaria TaxID=370345 RepID=A0ABD0KS93_9CAEN
MRAAKASQPPRQLTSPWLCSTGGNLHSLSFRYYLENTTACGLSVTLTSENGDVSVIWNTTAESSEPQVNVTLPNITSPSSRFMLKFEGRKIQKFGGSCGSFSNNVIAVNDVVYRKTDNLITTTTATSTPSSSFLSNSTQTAPVTSTTMSRVTAETVTNESTAEADSTLVPVTPDGNGESSGGAVAGIIIGVIIIALVVAIAVVFYMRRKKNKSFIALCPWMSKKTPEGNSPDMTNSAYYHGDEHICSTDPVPEYELANTNQPPVANSSSNRPVTDELSYQIPAASHHPNDYSSETHYDMVDSDADAGNYYSAPDDNATSNNANGCAKGDDSVYELAGAPDAGNNCGVTDEDSYNKLSHLNARPIVAVSDKDGTGQYSHLAEKQTRVPTVEPAGYGEYSLASADNEAGNDTYSKPSEKYMNEAIVPEPEEYNTLDFGEKHTMNTYANGRLPTDYSHLGQISASHEQDDSSSNPAVDDNHHVYHILEKKD